MTTAASATPEPTDKDKRQAALTQSYTAATRSLREAHRDEFNRLMASEAKTRGYEWAAPKTAAEKAEEQLQEILKQHPELASKMAPPQVVSGSTPTTIGGPAVTS